MTILCDNVNNENVWYINMHMKACRQKLIINIIFMNKWVVMILCLWLNVKENVFIFIIFYSMWNILHLSIL